MRTPSAQELASTNRLQVLNPKDNLPLNFVQKKNRNGELKWISTMELLNDNRNKYILSIPLPQKE